MSRAQNLTPTPTSSPSLPIRPADFSTLVEALEYAARGDCGLNFYSAHGELTEVLTYRELRERAIVTAQGMVRAGLPTGGRVVLVADTEPDFAILFMACQYAGLLAVPVSLPTALGSHESYVGGLRRQIQGCGAVAAAANAELISLLKEAAAGLDSILIGQPQEFYDLPGVGAELRPFVANGPCYLQYSSGSTRQPHGVDIPQRALASNCFAISNYGLQIRLNDRCVSWLPLYHDMGLVGFMLTPLFCQMSVDYLKTRDFARRPLLWLSLLTRNRSTLSYSPSFGYDLCSRRASTSQGLSLDLRSWRAAGIGGDMVQPDVLARFAHTFAEYGFSQSAFVPSYGMAETTLAVSFAPLDTGVVVDYVDRRKMTDQHLAVPLPAGTDQIRGFVVCGEPLRGHLAEIRDTDGSSLPDRHVGRIFVKGPSLMAGYYNEPDTTSAILGDDGWLDTGDLGYTLNKQLVITGRSKDLIIVNGRNIWPQDLEWAVEELPGVRRGDTCAFSITGNGDAEQVVVLVQCRNSDPSARADLLREIDGVIRRTAAIECRIVLIEPRGLPQTSSGKLSRARAKQRYLEGAFGAIASAARSSPAIGATAAASP
ncbi:MAG: fatty acyl-AMP ligase [Dongiaceae bacterium]